MSKKLKNGLVPPRNIIPLDVKGDIIKLGQIVVFYEWYYSVLGIGIITKFCKNTIRIESLVNNDKKTFLFSLYGSNFLDGDIKLSTYPYGFRYISYDICDRQITIIKENNCLQMLNQ